MVYGNKDAYVEDYLANCTPINVIPSYATIDEMAFYVIESSEIDFNNIMMETGIKELQYFESTRDVLTESDNFIDKAEKWFETTWEKAQKMIQDATNAIGRRADDFRKNILNKIDKKFIQDKIDNISPKRDFGASYDFKNIEDYKKYWGILDDLSKEVWRGYETQHGAHTTNGGSNSEVSDMDSFMTRTIERYVNKLTDQNETSISSVTKAIKDKLRGNPKDWKGADVKEKYKEIYEEVVSYPKTKRELKQSYNDLKSCFNKDIRKIKSAKDTKEESIFSKAIKGIKSCKQLAIAVEQSLISVLNERYSFYRSIMLKLIATKKVKESASVSSTSDAIDSLFDW